MYRGPQRFAFHLRGALPLPARNNITSSFPVHPANALPPLERLQTSPAGAPRPAINPTNLLFTAAAVLDSTVAADIEGPSHESFLEPKTTAVQGGDGDGSRRQRFSLAEKALLELADEVVAALESEQRRSDASAERRRFLVERRNSRGPGAGHFGGADAQALGKPPVGVPPLIWAMEIHLVSGTRVSTCVEAFYVNESSL